MAYAHASGVTNVNSLTVTQQPATKDTLTITNDETIADFTIASGAYKVTIKNVGVGSNGNPATATVNGQNLFPGDEVEFECKYDPSNNKLFLVPEINVVTNGTEIWYHVER
jgi:hypothetical protein